MDLLQTVSRANPDSHRFSVEQDGDLVAIVDYGTGFSYPVFCDESGNWVVRLGETSEAWVYPSLQKLLLLVWDEIVADSERVFAGF